MSSPGSVTYWIGQGRRPHHSPEGQRNDKLKWLHPNTGFVFSHEGGFHVLKEECDVKQSWETVDVLTRPLAPRRAHLESVTVAQ
jgi:hypothetical protein